MFLTGPNLICWAHVSRNFTAAPRSLMSRSCAMRQQSATAFRSCFVNPITKAKSSIEFKEARAKKAVGLIINPAGYTTTSVSILDALLMMEAPVIEVHITNIHAREEFRQHSYVSLAARAVIAGMGTRVTRSPSMASPP